METSGNIQILFAWLIAFQLVAVTFHDLVDIPGWTHGSQVQAVVGRRRLWQATIVNSIFPGLALAFAIYFWNRPKPAFVADYWMIYCAVTLASAISMWYVPYFRGATEDRKRNYAKMYSGTREILPPCGDNPRPNLLHVCFHVLFVITFALSLILRFRGG